MAATDINGKQIRKGDKVRRAAWGSDVIPEKRRAQGRVERVRAIGRKGSNLDGRITLGDLDVMGLSFQTWENGTNYEKI